MAWISVYESTLGNIEDLFTQKRTHYKGFIASLMFRCEDRYHVMVCLKGYQEALCTFSTLFLRSLNMHDMRGLHIQCLHSTFFRWLASKLELERYDCQGPEKRDQVHVQMHFIAP